MDRHTRTRIAALYDAHIQRGYVRGKLAGDPVYAATAALVAGSTLPLLDIGCGIGLLGHYLHAQAHVQPYLGLDHDPRKIAAGQRAVQRAGLEATIRLRCADAAELPPLSGHVALLDVLHYLPAARQPALLQVAAGHLAPNGCLIRAATSSASDGRPSPRVPPAIAGARTLSATRRRSFASYARYTAPIPPSPRRASMV